MIKGLYAAASAMLANFNRQSLLAHNAANIDTPGFKEALSSMQTFRSTPVSTQPASMTNSSALQSIGSLGLGVDTTAETIDFTAGGLQSTNQPLDLAINGGGFFRVKTPNGERYTRDGRFMRDSAGTLVTVDGYQVLNNSGQPITFQQQGVLSVAGEGTISVDGVAVGQVGLAVFKDPKTQLTRDLANTFAASSAPATAGGGTIQQSYLEMSNTDATNLMTQMTTVARAYEAAQQLVSIQDELLGQSVQSIGRL
jgi:flagellar basal-body rod protein FlgF